MVPINRYWNLTETSGPTGNRHVNTFRGRPTELTRKGRTYGYEGFAPDGSPQTVVCRGNRATFELTDMGEMADPKFILGQGVKFGKREGRKVTAIRLKRARTWEYYIPLENSPHGPYGNKYPLWCDEDRLAPV